MAKPIASKVSSQAQEPARSGVTRLQIWRAAAGMAIAVALASLMVAGSFSRQLARRDWHSRRIIVELRGRVRTLQHDLASAAEQLATLRRKLDNQLQLTSALTAPDATTIHLVAQPPAPKAMGMVAASMRTGHAIFHASGLPALAPDKIYELWWIGKRSGPVNAGIFRPDTQGNAATTALLPPAADRLVASEVTIEHLGGVAKPTGAAVLKGTIK